MVTIIGNLIFTQHGFDAASTSSAENCLRVILSICFKMELLVFFFRVILSDLEDYESIVKNVL